MNKKLVLTCMIHNENWEMLRILVANCRTKWQ